MESAAATGELQSPTSEHAAARRKMAATDTAISQSGIAPPLDFSFMEIASMEGQTRMHCGEEETAENSVDLKHTAFQLEWLSCTLVYSCD
jgi:hypothetical protein